jgi:hypothetical protein
MKSICRSLCAPAVLLGLTGSLGSAPCAAAPAASPGTLARAEARSPATYAAYDSGASHSALLNTVAASDTGAGNEWKDKLRRAPAQSGGAPLFGSRDWTPPPPPPPQARAVPSGPPPEPVPPPFPYRYMGRAEIEGEPPTVYLMKGSDIYPVAAGDTLEGVYRVEQLGDERIELTYLPLNKRQVVAYAAMGGAASGSSASAAQPDSVQLAPADGIPGIAPSSLPGAGRSGTRAASSDRRIPTPQFAPPPQIPVPPPVPQSNESPMPEPVIAPAESPESVGATMPFPPPAGTELYAPDGSEVR